MPSPATIASVICLLGVMPAGSAEPGPGAVVPEGPLRSLASEDFRTRETAQDQLVKWGREHRAQALTEFRQLAAQAPDPEVRERSLAILRDLVIDEYTQGFEGFIGISLMATFTQVPGETEMRPAIRVRAIYPGSPAAESGLKLNDVILTLDGKPFEGGEFLPDFQKSIRSRKPGTAVEMGVLRGDRIEPLTLNLGGMIPHEDLDRFASLGGDLEGAIRAAKEAYFRKWLRENR